MSRKQLDDYVNVGSGEESRVPAADSLVEKTTAYCLGVYGINDGSRIWYNSQAETHCTARWLPLSPGWTDDDHFHHTSNIESFTMAGRPFLNFRWILSWCMSSVGWNVSATITSEYWRQAA